MCHMTHCGDGYGLQQVTSAPSQINVTHSHLLSIICSVLHAFVMTTARYSMIYRFSGSHGLGIPRDILE